MQLKALLNNCIREEVLNMDFGLGLILSFTDNASGGILNAVNGLNQLTETASNASNSLTGLAQLGAFSVVADQMGSSFIKAGSGIMGMFTNLLGHVQQTGSDFESFRITLNALYQDEARAQEQLNKLLDFSVKSPFEVGDVKDMLVVLQSQGIDAFEQMTGAIHGTRQESLSWLADLMAFKPDIPVTRWKLAITNFLGSGMPKVLENALDMGHIEDIIGHSIGDTAEERMNSLVELVDKKNLSGLADNMSKSWAGVASNIDDAWTKLYMSIADNGVFDKLKSSFMGVAGAIMSLDNDEIASLGKTIADGLNIIVTPITIVAEKVNVLITGLVKLCQTNPELVKMGMVIVAVAGALMVIMGIVLKVASALGMLTIGLTQFSGAFHAVAGLLKAGALKVVGALLPMTLAIGLMYMMWKNDLGGVRTLLTNFVANIRSSFSTAREACAMNVNGMMGVVGQLESKGDFWSNFTVGIIKVKTLAEALCDAWSDYTLSEDVYLKCKELGILPLVEAILDLKWRLEHFWAGFKEGVSNVVAFFVNGFKKITSALKGTFIGDALDKLTEFFQFLTNNDPEAWRSFGKVVGEIAAAIIPFVAAMKLFGKVSSVGSIFPRILGGILNLFRRGGNGGGGGNNGGGILSQPGKVLKTFASIVIIIGGAVAVIEAIGALSKVPGFNDFLSSGASTMAKLASSMLSIVAVGGAMGLLVAMLNGLSVSPSVAAKGIADLAILIGGLDVLIIALGALNSIPHFAEFLSSGSIVMNQLMNTLGNMFNIKAIAVMGLITAFGLVPIPTVLAGLANLTLLIGGMTLLIEAFGALSQIPGFNEFLQSGGDSLALLFQQIGKIAGSFVGGIAEGLTEALPGIGQNIAEFGQNIRPFFDAINGADLSGISEFTSALGTFALKLTANEFLSMLGGKADYVALAEQLTQFGEKLKPFFDSVAQYSDEGLAKAPAVFKSLAGIGDYDFKTGGLAQLFTGNTSLDVIGKQLVKFAPNGATFFNAVAGYSEEGLEKAPKVFQALKGIGDYDFKTGGLAQLFTGETSIAHIGSELANFAENGGKFFNAVATYSDDGLRKAPLVFKALSGIGDYDFKTGGLAQLFTGSTNLSEIGEQLSDFIEEARSFFDGVSNIPLDSFTKANSLFSTLNELNQAGFDFGNIYGLSMVGSELTYFGNNVQGFFLVINNIPFSSFSKVTTLFNSLSSMEKVMSIASSSSGSLKSFGDEMKSFADDMQYFSEKISQIDMSGLPAFTDGLQTLSNKFGEVKGGISDGANTIIDSFGKVVNKSGDMSSSFSSDMDTMLTKQNTTFTQMATIADTTFTQMVTMISTKMQTAVQAVQTAVNTMKSTMNFSWSLPHLKVPHVNVSGKFNLDPPSAPNFSVDWYAKGGVFDKPNIIGVGEAGKEAVMPLENNTGWINDLAFMISRQIMSVEDRQFTPMDSSVTNNNSQSTSEDRYMTSNVTNNNNAVGDTDNSITFAEGAIQINCQNASEEEAMRMAKVIMEYIKRQQQLDKMLAYG